MPFDAITVNGKGSTNWVMLREFIKSCASECRMYTAED
jgi:hypothetical protein